MIDIRQMDPDDLAKVVIAHPLQRKAVNEIARLITALRECTEACDYYNLQCDLGTSVLEVEGQRARVRQSIKRLRVGKAPLTEAPAPPSGLHDDEMKAWQLQDAIYERVCRQLRSVGDAMAWRASGFDRAYVTAISSNASPGMMVGKEGLGWELGALKGIYEETGHFALHHDLTNCLRIGDLTEFCPDDLHIIHEIKARGGRVEMRQVKRLDQAVAAVNNGAHLPGDKNSGMFRSQEVEHHLDVLSDAMDLAEERAFVGIKIPGRRAVVAANLETAVTKYTDLMEGERVLARARTGVLKRAGLISSTAMAKVNSGDRVARVLRFPPFGIYPMAPRHCAKLICDWAVFEVMGDSSAVVDALYEEGASRVEVREPMDTKSFVPGEVVMIAYKGERGVRVGKEGLDDWLMEFIELRSYAKALLSFADATPLRKKAVITFPHVNAWL